MIHRNLIRLIVAAIVATIALGAGGLGGANTSAGAQAETELEIDALDIDEVERGDRIEAAYELTVSEGLAFDVAFSSSLCGQFDGPDEGDDDSDDILDEDETWVFDCRRSFTGMNDVITVLARAEDGTSIRAFDQRPITYLDDEEGDDDEGDDEDGEDDAETDDDGEEDSEAEADDGDDEEATGSGSSNTRRWLFWAMAGAALGLVLCIVGYLLWRSRQAARDEERLFL